MFTMLFSMAGRLWKPALIVAFAGAAFIYREVLVYRLDAARAQAIQSEQRNAELLVSNQQFQAAVNICNAKVDRFRTDAQRAEQAVVARAAAAAHRARQQAAATDAAAAALGRAQITAGCKGAIQWANQQGPELGRW
jgi:hypothetical protein